ncbi:hypothetical protein [Variovorax ginsengisoli]|uniref:Uncharacterized protein n=1 Tax=Variovorax ginsengisoli TaxID=363844 RepID=A0ABT8RZ54_9BURK|nr:hypothetical protein [Variovorax ginsengisoli]MDN8612787.1 hypothetical protein [Variovorax ginsengisoli]MDO1531957.1 hypothetical protein [Variovorax ginsengisoli]
MALKLVQPSEPPLAEKVRQRVKRTPKPAAMLECRCGSREFIETKSGVLLKDGKPTGGTKTLICAICLLKGERVVVA